MTCLPNWQQIEAKLAVLNEERLKDGLFSLSLAKISLLGQFSPLHPEINSKIQLANTAMDHSSVIGLREV
jgi:hypothetical protein